MSKVLTKRNGAVALALAVGLVIGTAGLGNAGGTGIPANKATAAGSQRVVLKGDEAKPILTATLKTSKPTDLILQLTMECSIFTQLKTSGGSSSTAGATGTVKAWITIDGVVVPITSKSQPPQDPPPTVGVPPLPGEDDPAAPHDGATMCSRAYHRMVTDNEAGDGQDTEDDYIKTKSANGFNWLRQNAGSGIHTIEVWAILDQVKTGEATARAEIGNRTLIVEPTKMANDAVIAENGTS